MTAFECFYFIMSCMTAGYCLEKAPYEGFSRVMGILFAVAAGVFWPIASVAYIFNRLHESLRYFGGHR